MSTRSVAALILASLTAACAAAPSDSTSAVLRELAPTGKLRVAIGVAPTPSAFYAIKDPPTGSFRGVTIDLATALAQELDVPVEFIAYRGSGEIQALANNGVWDVTFMPVDDERKQVMDFGSPYHVMQSTYLVKESSPIASVADANAAGVRIVGVAESATFRASNRASSQATHVARAGVEEAVAVFRAGEADAMTMSRDTLGAIAATLPGTRILDGAFLNSTTAVAVPKGKPAALAYVAAFVEDAKASGLVRRSLDSAGLKNAVVAPAGMRP